MASRLNCGGSLVDWSVFDARIRARVLAALIIIAVIEHDDFAEVVFHFDNVIVLIGVLAAPLQDLLYTWILDGLAGLDIANFFEKLVVVSVLMPHMGEHGHLHTSFQGEVRRITYPFGALGRKSVVRHSTYMDGVAYFSECMLDDGFQRVFGHVREQIPHGGADSVLFTQIDVCSKPSTKALGET